MQEQQQQQQHKQVLLIANDEQTKTKVACCCSTCHASGIGTLVAILAVTDVERKKMDQESPSEDRPASRLAYKSQSIHPCSRECKWLTDGERVKKGSDETSTIFPHPTSMTARWSERKMQSSLSDIHDETGGVHYVYREI